MNAAGTDFRATPERYTTINELKKATKDFVMPDLVETYGDQGITGFLELTGAVKSGGTSDQIDWYEVGRRHATVTTTHANVSDVNGNGTVLQIAAADAAASKLQANDVVMDTTTGARFIVESGGFGSGTAANAKLVKLDGTAFTGSDHNVGADGEFVVLGNMYAQGYRSTRRLPRDGHQEVQQPVHDRQGSPRGQRLSGHEPRLGELWWW